MTDKIPDDIMAKAREVVGKAYRSDPAEKDLGDDSGVIAERFEPV